MKRGEKMGRIRSNMLEVRGLWKIYGFDGGLSELEEPKELNSIIAKGGLVAVRNVSFNVMQGEVFVIMGLSGSGKSTLIRCLLRLIEPTAGSVVVNGVEITGMDQQQLIHLRRTKVAMVFQHYGLLPHRTVLENVTFGLKLRGVDRASREAIGIELIGKVGLAGRENDYPNSLSGGMQQRVGIARALAQDPYHLLMDEPFSGLDPLIRREMQDELMRLQKEFNKTVVFVTHDLNEAFHIGDRMAVMRDGQFVQVGRPEEIVANPADEYVEKFVWSERKSLRVLASPPKRQLQRHVVS